MLANTFKNLKLSDLSSEGKMEEFSVEVAFYSRDLTYENGEAGRKLKYLQSEIGEELFLQLCFLIKSFSDSIRSKDKLRNAEIVEAAGMILQEYPYESLEDFAMAFKRSKLRGDVFYAGLDIAGIFRVVNTYLEEKAGWREAEQTRKKKEFIRPVTPDELPADPDIKERFAELQSQIKKVGHRQIENPANQRYFTEALKIHAATMSLDELIECRKSYENQSRDPDRFTEELSIIDAQIENRKSA